MAGPTRHHQNYESDSQYNNYQQYSYQNTGYPAQSSSDRGSTGRGGARGGYRSTPYSRSDSRSGHGGNRQHQSQDSSERSMRTLFIRNIPYDLPPAEIRALFQNFGEIKGVFDLISRRGLFFVTFYDLRCAIRAKTTLSGTEFQGRPIDVHYSLPKESDLKGRCDAEKNQGSLHLEYFPRSSDTVSLTEIYTLMARYGDVREVRPLRQENNFIAEYWDSRHAVNAYDDIRRDERFRDGYFEIRFVWDDRRKLDRRDEEPFKAKPTNPADTTRPYASQGPSSYPPQTAYPPVPPAGPSYMNSISTTLSGQQQAYPAYQSSQMPPLAPQAPPQQPIPGVNQAQLNQNLGALLGLLANQQTQVQSPSGTPMTISPQQGSQANSNAAATAQLGQLLSMLQQSGGQMPQLPPQQQTSGMPAPPAQQQGYSPPPPPPPQITGNTNAVNSQQLQTLASLLGSVSSTKK